MFGYLAGRSAWVHGSEARQELIDLKYHGINQLADVVGQGSRPPQVHQPEAALHSGGEFKFIAIGHGDQRFPEELIDGDDQ
jgi:hypothetical protein